jgi:hypothetical protein
MINQELIPDIADDIVNEVRSRLPESELWEVGALLTSVGTYLLMSTTQEHRDQLNNVHKLTTQMLMISADEKRKQ